MPGDKHTGASRHWKHSIVLICMERYESWFYSLYLICYICLYLRTNISERQISKKTQLQGTGGSGVS